MALFTDGTISTLEDLAAQDTTVLNFASAEGIDLTAKSALAQEELGLELTSSFLRMGAYDARLGSFGSPSVFPNQLRLENIVVTSPLRLWHTFRTLALAYGDAYNSQLNDRYFGKWKEYRERSKWALEMLYQIGVGFVWDPIPAAAAPFLSSIPGPLVAATYYAAVTWINGTGEEGKVGAVASLVKPDGALLRATPADHPVNASWWNIYAAISPDALALQNATPLDASQSWIEPLTGLVPGRRAGNGQQPSFLRALPRTLQRG